MSTQKPVNPIPAPPPTVLGEIKSSQRAVRSKEVADAFAMRKRS